MNSNESLQIWDGAPQCPICDGPLQYYTDDGEDYNATTPMKKRWAPSVELNAANAPGITALRIYQRWAF